MNSPETTELEVFLDQLEQIHEIEKVAETDAMIKRAVAQQLDAAHVLVQRALLLGRALTQAKARFGEVDRTPQLAAAALELDEAADRLVLEADFATDDYLFV